MGNPAMADSPLDSPADAGTYIEGVKAKFEALFEASQQLGAEVLITADVGCGVFQNDPRVVGGCFGATMASHGSHLKQVILATHNNDFILACKSSAKGEDPRNACSQG